MRDLKLISGLIIILILSGCSVEQYYFPMSELTNSKVYKYECKLNPNKTEYWKLTSNLKDKTLTSKAYTSNFRQYELFKEQMTNKGSEVIEFTSYSTNRKGVRISLQNALIDVDVFKWKTNEPYTYSAETEYDDNTKTLFSKQREYIGKSKIVILGKEYEAIKLKGYYKTVLLNSKEKYEYVQYSYYIKGIGLAKMEKEYTDGTTETLELTEIMTLKEWDKIQ